MFSIKEREWILIADDMEINRTILAELFCDQYEVVEADNGFDAMAIVRSMPFLCLVLLDIVMPRMNGYEVLQTMREEGYLNTIPAVVVTAQDSSESEIRAFDLGASDLITKPIEPHVVRRRVDNIIDLYRHKNRLESLVKVQAHKLQTTNEAMIDALSSVIEYRNMESGQHIRRIRLFTKILLNRVARTPFGAGWDPSIVDIISGASSMHDIGKISIPDAILTKPGRLTADEFEVMKTHTVKGGELVKNFSWMDSCEYLRYAYLIARYHHERWDGRGYPEGLAGNDIPVCAIVAGLADVYDALTSLRVYKPAYSHETAMAMILNGECGCFPQWLLNCFCDVADEFAALAQQYADRRMPHPVKG